MILRRSLFVHIVPIDVGRVLILHALTHLRLGVDEEVARLIVWFEQPRELPAAIPALTKLVRYDVPTLAACVSSLIERGILTEKTPDEELIETAAGLARTGGRDPGEMLELLRRERHDGAQPYWAGAAARGIGDFDGRRRQLTIVLLGDCDLQMEADFLAQEGARRGLELHIAATFPDDTRLVGERSHDMIMIGALRSRNSIAFGRPEDHAGEPFRGYVTELTQLLEKLRAQSIAPILVDNLPEPTVQPLGLAERGLHGHRNRFRQANLMLAEAVESFGDVHVADIAAALAATGTEALLDDGLTGFTHFGSPGWMLQRPKAEMAAVHGVFPDFAPLEALVSGDPYRREKVVARAHVDLIVSVMAVDRKKCIIVDLDGVLWPGVLAETGSPFAWHPEISGPHSYIGLFFGIHEALKTLKRRGIILAAVSKNDESVVRELWTYPDHYPHDRLLTPEDFVTWRINWGDKAENVRSISEEIGFSPDTFLFIDDHPVERERIRRKLPEVEVWGDELFTLRRRLLSDPRLQLPSITSEAEARTALVKAQLRRDRLRADAPDESAFLTSLGVDCHVERMLAGAPVERIHELFERTTQFNATGRKFSAAELSEMLSRETGLVFTLRVRDCFGDYGLVGSAIISAGEIVGFAVSCRVMGLDVEHKFVDAILSEISASFDRVTARIVETSRNFPVRNLYRDNGFELQPDGRWQLILDHPRERRRS